MLPLDKQEIELVVHAVRAQGGLDETAWFETIAPDESQGRQPQFRGAYVCCYEPSSNRTIAGVVNLEDGQLQNWEHQVGMQARIVGDEFTLACELARKHPAFIEALDARGVDDPSKVLVESWSPGNFGSEEENTLRLAYGHCWLINDAGDNPYARPIANLHPVFDLGAREIIRIDDFGAVPIPPDPGPIIRTKQRSDLKPLAITQEQGPSFEVDGYQVKWQNWQVQVGFSVREGLILYDIGYHDNHRTRSILHRASMAEMVVPYGDPRHANYRRNAFDVGEYGVGAALDSLALGCDCVGHIHYFDVWSHDWHGNPTLIKNAVCMHEEDYGVLWKYSEPRSGQSTVTRSRRLVISSIATIGNYVYGFFWYFYQDGTIGVEVKATGIPFPSGIGRDERSDFGALVAEGVESHVHQHVFGFRLDMAVDGEKNTVTEMNFSSAPMGENNPYGNAIVGTETPLTTEQQAQRKMDLDAARYWKITNPEQRNRFGQPVAYKLLPGINAMPFQHPDSPVGKRAGFMYKHLWVTQYEPSELYPAGWFPNQHSGGDGLPKWTEGNRSVDNEDIVVWYTMNYHHLPRPEDWPVQPTVYCGFHLMPVGFFDENPAMDVPRTR
ncbi:MAG: primary-amine oxidase [Granulosicoccus sp.]|nr:primary-amine oxidase [Granulosicoccus sp.]